MARGLPQEVIEKAQKEVSVDDCFCFECQRCGQCCFCCEIVVTPYDILRLCQGLRTTTSEFLDRYGQITLGPESGLPVCWLDFEKVQQWQGGDERTPPCPFLAPFVTNYFLKQGSMNKWETHGRMLPFYSAEPVYANHRVPFMV